MFTLKDFTVGMRVELHPGTDLWMRGARYGNVTKIGRKVLHVKLDKLPRAIRVCPANIGRILEG